MCEAWDDGQLHVVAKLKVPSGMAKKALLRLADSDLNGRLSAEERALMKSRLVARALSGLKLHVGSATVALDGVQTKLKVDASPKGPVTLMLHGRVALPRTEVAVGLSTGQVGDPLKVQVLAGKRPALRSNRAPIIGGGFTVELLHGDQVRWTLPAIAATPEPK